MTQQCTGETNSHTSRNFVTTSARYTKKKWGLLRNWVILFYICIGKPGVSVWFADTRWVWYHEEQLSGTKAVLGIKYCLWDFSFRDKRFEDIELSVDRGSIFLWKAWGPPAYTNTLFHFLFDSTRLCFLLLKRESEFEFCKFGSNANIELSFNTWFLLQVTGLLRLMGIVRIIIITVLPIGQSVSKIYFSSVYTVDCHSGCIYTRGSTWHPAATWHGRARHWHQRVFSFWGLLQALPLVFWNSEMCAEVLCRQAQAIVCGNVCWSVVQTGTGNCVWKL